MLGVTLQPRLVRGIVGGLLLAAGACFAAPIIPPLITSAAGLAPAASRGATAATETAVRRPAANPLPGDPLPACRYADVRTRYRSTADWQMTLVDTERKVGKSYVPPHLVPVSRANLPGTGRIRSIVIDDLAAMAKASRKAGAGIAVESAYRSYALQKAVFQMWVDRDGYQAALLSSARAGHSEHQLGTTLDVRSAKSGKAPWEYADWGTTAAGAWMKANAWKYGFVMSYPKGKTQVSCYQYEPWHFRYVGRALAADIHASHQVTRRYLWNHFETAP